MKAACLTLCAILAACGGGGSEAPEAAPLSACQQGASVLLLGDSTMKGAPGPLLQAAMDAKYGAGRVAVTNLAVGSMTSADALSGRDGNGGIAATLAAHPADVVIDNHGMNDMQHRLSVAGYEKRLLQIKAIAGPRLLFQTPNPVTADGPVGAQWKVDALPAYVDAMRRVGGNLIDVDAYVRSLPGWQLLLRDGLHPSDELQAAIVSGAMAPAVAASLDHVLCGAK